MTRRRPPAAWSVAEVCGICGFVNLDGNPASGEIVGRMNRALIHRGPDDEGALLDGPIALAMRRLSIMDPEGGHQPIGNEQGTAWVVFNGEIYNASELRKVLQGCGHRFATDSDTEVIIHQYEESGDNCASMLRGMFAFAILDKRAAASPRLLLARDRVGIKPLYYYHDESLLAFSSELTSLVQHPAIERQIESAALRQYLATGVVGAPLTMFRGVRQLMPGERMLLEDGRVTMEDYWCLPESQPQPPSDDEAVFRIRALLEDAVSEHLISDVPVGAFLSGGIDSSTVVALMARASGRKVPTFSVRFEESGYDESAYARLVAERYKTDHHEFVVPNCGFDADLLQAMITHHGQPTADSSALPMFMVSKVASDYVKVVLSGDGGDESFAGYAHYGWLTQIGRLYALHPALRKGAAGMLRALTAAPGASRSRRLRQLINALEASLAEKQRLPFEVLRLNREHEIDALLTPQWRLATTPGEDVGVLERFLDGQPAHDPVAQAQRFSFRYFLPDAYLPKVDRMSMAASLEVRVPFLDHRIVEYALALPGQMHWRDGRGKYLLRQAVADLLPAEIFTHRKQGFSIPLHRWATDDYFSLAEELLNEEVVERRGLFDPCQVRLLLDRSQGRDEHRQALESDYRLSHRLFMLMVLEMWCRLYLDNLVERPSQANLGETVRHG